MYIKTGLAVLFMACTLMLTGCGGGGADFSTPEATLRTAARAMETGDRELFISCVVKGEQEELREGDEGEQPDFTSVTVVEVGEEHGFTVGRIRTQVGDEEPEEMPLVLVEEDGEWKISFEKLGELMFAAMREGGFEMEDE
jgi:hypothetical protein